MLTCWRPQPHERARIRDIRQRLEQFLTNESQYMTLLDETIEANSNEERDAEQEPSENMDTQPLTGIIMDEISQPLSHESRRSSEKRLDL